MKNSIVTKKNTIITLAIILVITGLIAFLFVTKNNSTNVPANGFDSTPLASQIVQEDVEIRQEVVLGGLTKPWGIGILPDESLLYTERAGGISLYKDGDNRELLVPADLDARGEGGLLGVAVDPEYAQNKFVYVCYNTSEDVRVVRYELEANTLKNDTPIVTAMPTAASGRHSGCRIGFGPDGYIWVGTGDAADGENPQSPTSLGGKVLRVDRDGRAAEKGNLSAPFDARIYSYGHRNIQGLAFARDASYIGITTEHGPSTDDEVNHLVLGNFGWNPVPGYNESVPMTDLVAYSDAISAQWASGSPTVALSGATFVYGESWGQYDGSLFAGTLKAKKILHFSVDKVGDFIPENELFVNEFGRIRSIEQAPSGALFVTTDNGEGTDKIIKLTPSSTL